MKFKFYTLGCKVNQYESEALSSLLKLKGHTIAADDEAPDVFVINSCTVTAESDRKSRQMLRRYKKEYPNAIMVLTGCMVQASPKKGEDISEADLIIGNTDQNLFYEKIERYIKNKTRLQVESHEKGELYSTPEAGALSEHTRAFMKIEDGCDRFCSYCIIPYSKGRVRSRSIEDIKSEAEHLAQNGYKEIVLVGINLSAFGKDNGKDLADAVEIIEKIDGIERIRLGSLEPDFMSNEMLYRLANCSKFCPQFHLALQSGCDKTLKAMNRHYDTDFYKSLVDKIRSMFYNCSFTTDLMVGFAGESVDDFTQSCRFAESIGFLKIHIFPYSVREGTVAAKMNGQIEKREKERRADVMSDISEKSALAFHKSQIGKTVSVLFETYEFPVMIGHTENGTPVRVFCEEDLNNQIKEVKIISANKDFCIAKFN